MKQVIERLRKLADEAIKEYNSEHVAGGEAVYPAWADDVLYLLKCVDAIGAGGVSMYGAATHITEPATHITGHLSDATKVVGVQPVLPDPLQYDDVSMDLYVTGWNDFRAAMLSRATQSDGQADSQRLQELLLDPVVVHRNMLLGKIAKIDMLTCAHTHGAAMVKRWRECEAQQDAPAMVGDEWIAKAHKLASDLSVRQLGSKFRADAREAFDSHLRQRVQPASGDAKFLVWLSTNLFERKWGGTIGNPCEWHLRGDWRHTIQRMKGPDIRAAITQAIHQERQS